MLRFESQVAIGLRDYCKFCEMAPPKRRADDFEHCRGTEQRSAGLLLVPWRELWKQRGRYTLDGKLTDQARPTKTVLDKSRSTIVSSTRTELEVSVDSSSSRPLFFEVLVRRIGPHNGLCTEVEKTAYKIIRTEN